MVNLIPLILFENRKRRVVSEEDCRPKTTKFVCKQLNLHRKKRHENPDFRFDNSIHIKRSNHFVHTSTTT